MDGWVRGRLRAILRKRQGGRGRGRGKDHHRWGKRLLCRTRTLLPERGPSTGMASLRQGAKVLTGKPDAGDPPVRFGGRGGESHPRSYPNPLSPLDFSAHSPFSQSEGPSAHLRNNREIRVRDRLPPIRRHATWGRARTFHADLAGHGRVVFAMPLRSVNGTPAHMRGLTPLACHGGRVCNPSGRAQRG